MPKSSIWGSVSWRVWMLWTVKSERIPIARAAAGTRPVIQSLQCTRSGRTTGMMLLITSRWNASAMRGFTWLSPE